MTDHSALERAFREYARALLGPYDVGRVLYRLTDQVVEVLGIDGAGVSIAGDDGLEFLTATDERIVRIEEHQIGIGQGPCQDAFRTGRPTTSDDLESERRWPDFTPFAIEVGCRSLGGVPMPAGERTIGAIDLYSFEPRRWSEEELDAAQLLADMAAGYVLNARELDETRKLSTQLQHALDTRIVIEQAKGIIVARNGLDMAQAFARLRDHARSNRRPVHDVARDVVDGGLEL